MNTWIVKGACIASVLWGLTAAHALTVDEARGIAVGDSDARIEALSKAVAQGDDKTAAYLQALADDVVKTANGQVLVVRDGQGTDPVTGQAVTVPPDAEEVMLNNRLRGEIDTALAALKLFSPDVKVRRQAALSLLKEPDASRAPLLEKALAAEQDPAVQSLVRQARAAALLGSEVPNERLLAARELADSRQPETLLLLNQQLSQEQEPSVQQQIQKSLAAVQDSLRWGERLGTLFTGASLGSILLLVALGLAITYGLRLIPGALRFIKNNDARFGRFMCVDHMMFQKTMDILQRGTRGAFRGLKRGASLRGGIARQGFTQYRHQRHISGKKGRAGLTQRAKNQIEAAQRLARAGDGGHRAGAVRPPAAARSAGGAGPGAGGTDRQPCARFAIGQIQLRQRILARCQAQGQFTQIEAGQHRLADQARGRIQRFSAAQLGQFTALLGAEADPLQWLQGSAQHLALRG